MRKLLLSMLLCLSLVLSLGALSEAIEPDVDLTDVDTEDAINALYDLAEEPEANLGKLVRLRGHIAYSNWDGEEIFLLLGDGASCCAAQVEFVPAEVPEDLDQMTLADKLFTVQGALDIFDNGGFEDVRLIDAQFDLN